MEKKETVFELDVDKIYANPNQPRKNFDENLITDLALSISKHGVISPIVVQKKESGYYMIIAGERRFRAAKKLGKTTIPAIVRVCDDKQVDEIALIENLQREDLNPVDEAKGLKRLMQEYNLTQEELAVSVGKSRSAIANKLRLLTLSREVLFYLEKGALSEAHARTLIPLEVKYQKFFLNKIRKEGWSVRKTETEVKKLTEKAAPKQSQEKPQELNELTQRLEHILQTRVTVVGTGEKGKITVEYFTPDDLNRLFEIIDKIEQG